MKNRSILLALVLSIGFFATSCSDGDNDGETLAPLAGKWNITQVGTTVNGEEFLMDPPQNEDGCAKDYLDLNIDNTLTEGDYDSTITPCAEGTTDGIYSRSHNDLTTVINGITTVKDIVNLTLTQLKTKDDNGAIIVYTRA